MTCLCAVACPFFCALFSVGFTHLRHPIEGHRFFCTGALRAASSITTGTWHLNSREIHRQNEFGHDQWIDLPSGYVKIAIENGDL